MVYPVHCGEAFFAPSQTDTTISTSTDSLSNTHLNLLSSTMCTTDAPQHRTQGTNEPAAVKDSSHSDIDVEKQESQTIPEKEQSSAFKALGWLDRLLALWILLAMIVGILLGNFVPSTGPALQKGKFVGVSIPIGMPYFLQFSRNSSR